jgi:hypothetical protein
MDMQFLLHHLVLAFDPGTMGLIATGPSLAASGLKVFGAVKAGYAEEAADKFKAQELPNAAEIGRPKAAQIMGYTAREATRTTANVRVMTARCFA